MKDQWRLANREEYSVQMPLLTRWVIRRWGQDRDVLETLTHYQDLLAAEGPGFMDAEPTNWLLIGVIIAGLLVAIYFLR